VNFGLLQLGADFCVPLEGSKTFEIVYGAALRRVLGDLCAFAPGSRIGTDIRRLLKEEPGALASLARLPTVSTLLRCLRGAAPAEREALTGELVATLGLELALSGLMREPLRVTSPPAEILALGARRRVRLAERTGEAIIECDGSVRSAASVDETFFEVTPSIVLSLADNNPMRMIEAHPDKKGNAIDLGGKTAAEWTEALRGALLLIDAHLPAFRREIDLVLRQLVPVGFFPEAHLSASYQEAIGTVYLSLHPSPLTMAEAIVHEVSHNKLNALFDLDPVIENDPDETYASPVRPDPRPILGVLLAVHAFLPVEQLYKNMLQAGAAPGPAEIGRHFERVRALNRQGAEVLLAHGRPTAVGKRIFEELARLTESPAGTG
jgi:HEXXH motif-containing protein